MPPIRDYFLTRSLNKQEREAAASALWSDNGLVVDQLDTLLEQYKLYVEMADRVSARRLQANTFFLTLNTAVLALMGAVLQSGTNMDKQYLLFPFLALVIQCLTWFWIIRAYRQLNTIKWAVVGFLEQRLPARPYSDAEWEAVGRGTDPSLYWPLTRIEAIVPILFAMTYIGTYLLIGS